MAPARIQRTGGSNPISSRFQHLTQRFVPGMLQPEMRIYGLFPVSFLGRPQRYDFDLLRRRDPSERLYHTDGVSGAGLRAQGHVPSA